MNIGRFYNVTEFGHGGMGTVYSGYCDGKKVAIKKFRREFMSEAELINRFRLEAQTLQRLHHSSIVKIIEPSHDTNNRFYPAFEENGELYLAMEFVEGDTLEHYVRKCGGPLSEAKAIQIMNNILDAMEYVRQQGIIHRDIKPSNIIIRPDGVSICIIDFGIVKDLNGSGMTTGRCVLGTDGYMSPEQANGLTVDSRTDIYSLGCLLFYMLTGTHAIENKASPYETRMAIIKDDFPRAKDINPYISDRVQAIIDKAVNKNMTLRFQSPQEFKMELNLSGSTVPGSTVESDTDMAISVGRDNNCDITIYDPNEKVSRQHLNIIWHQTTEEFEIIDRSTNGTEVNGRFIHNSSCRIYFPHDYHKYGPDIIPTVILAQTKNLSWDTVLDKFKEKANQIPGDSETSTHPGDEKRGEDYSISKKLSAGYSLLCFFFPIVGWVLYYQWKRTAPRKAKQALKLAWIGFAINFILSLIINLSQI